MAFWIVQTPILILLCGKILGAPGEIVCTCGVFELFILIRFIFLITSKNWTLFRKKPDPNSSSSSTFHSQVFNIIYQSLISLSLQFSSFCYSPYIVSHVDDGSVLYNLACSSTLWTSGVTKFVSVSCLIYSMNHSASIDVDNLST